MKRIISLLLTAVLLLIPCGAFASGIAGGALLGGNAEEAAPVTLYPLTEIGITIELPEDWMVLTTEPDQESILPMLMGMTKEEFIASLLQPMGGHLYALTDLMTFGQLFIVVDNGMPGVDMRVDKMALDIDSFMKGFLNGFTQNLAEEDVIACDLFTTDTAHFARIAFYFDDGSGIKVVNVQYCTNVNGMIYIIQYVGSDAEISEETLAQLDAAVSSIKFVEAE